MIVHAFQYKRDASYSALQCHHPRRCRWLRAKRAQRSSDSRSARPLPRGAQLPERVRRSGRLSQPSRRQTEVRHTPNDGQLRLPSPASHIQVGMEGGCTCCSPLPSISQSDKAQINFVQAMTALPLLPVSSFCSRTILCRGAWGPLAPPPEFDVQPVTAWQGSSADTHTW